MVAEGTEIKEIPEEVMDRAVKTVLFCACWICNHWAYETFDDLDCEPKEGCIHRAKKVVKEVRLILAGEDREIGICPRCLSVAPYEFDTATGIIVTYGCPKCGTVVKDYGLGEKVEVLGNGDGEQT